MSASRPLLLFIVMSALLLTACSGPAEQSPAQRRIEALREVIHGGVSAAVEEVDQAAPYALSARWNPVAGCDCPSFEVYHSGNWRRVYLEGSEEAMITLERYQETVAPDEPLPPDLSLEGTPTQEVRRCEGTGQLLGVVQVDRVELR